MKSFPSLPAMFAILALSCGVPQVASAATDFSDNRSFILTSKAWDNLSSQNFADALAYVDHCVEQYGNEAKRMQGELKTRPTNETKEQTSARWALNDVGTCVFIKAEILMKKGDKAGAKEAYAQLVKDFPDAMCWDPKGWFWAPADAAKSKLVELDFDAK